MQTNRPLSDRWSVGFAGLALVALAAGSFTSGLLRQMNVPSPDNSAQVVVMAPKDAPPPTSLVLAQTVRPAAAPARDSDQPRRRALPDQAEAVAEPPAVPEQAPSAETASTNAVSAEAPPVAPPGEPAEPAEPPPAGLISP